MSIFTKQRRIVVNNRYSHAASIRNGGVMIRLTLKKLIILSVILLVLLVWAFFVGVLVGQGINAEDKVEALAGSNSTALNTSPDVDAVAPELPEMAKPPRVAEEPAPTPAKPKPAQNAAPAAQRPNTAGTDAQGNSGDTVISPQELSFMTDLKDKPAPPNPAKSNEDGAQQRAAAQKPQRAAAQNSQADAGANAGRPEDPAPKATTSPGPGIFDYQYQVAATSDLEGAKRLVNQLRADGLRASMVQGNKDGSKLYRVHVDFRGTPSDTNQLRDQLAKFGINRVLLKTKVATQ